MNEVFPWLKAIAAVSENGVIGNGLAIPWHIPEDFAFFKKKTSGHAVLFGRKTFESIGRPLPNRTNIVLSRTMSPKEGIILIRKMEELFEDREGFRFNDERYLWVCGGAEIYREFLPHCSELYLTRVKGNFEGDVLFPENFLDFFDFVENILEHERFTIKRYISHESR